MDHQATIVWNMHYTITLNPALDLTLWVDRLIPDISNRIEKEQRYPGGKGIGVSRVLTTLGVYNRALGFAGGFRGTELEALMVGTGTQCDFTTIHDETRSNIVIHERLTNRQHLLTSKGPEISSEELDQFLSSLETLESPAMVSIGGSLPPDLDPCIYGTIISRLKKRGARIILDADGEALAEGVRAGPYAVKPNIHELAAVTGRDLSTMDQILAAAESLRGKGAEMVLVSMGKNGILLSHHLERYHAVPPPVVVKNTIGAGDSAVAGFIYGLTMGYTLKHCLVFAVASGTATTLREGSALAERDDIMNLAPQITVRELREV